MAGQNIGVRGKREAQAYYHSTIYADDEGGYESPSAHSIPVHRANLSLGSMPCHRLTELVDWLTCMSYALHSACRNRGVNCMGLGLSGLYLTQTCPSNEDEINCAEYVCVEMLHCIQEDVCVPIHEVCDGRIHCIQPADDEYLCDTPKCPDPCFCHGLAISCIGAFLTSSPVYRMDIKNVDMSNNMIARGGQP